MATTMHSRFMNRKHSVSIVEDRNVKLLGPCLAARQQSPYKVTSGGSKSLVLPAVSDIRKYRK